MSEEGKKKEGLKKAFAAIDRMLEGFPEHQRQRLMRSYCISDPEERKARLKLVQELSVELAEVRKQDRFVLFGESAIEAVIEGDWKGATDRIEWLTFKKEPLVHMERMAPIWARFREMLAVACAEARLRHDLAVKHALGQKEGN